MDELRPCPFCGGIVEMLRTNDNKNRPFPRCKYGSLLVPPCPASSIISWAYSTEEEAAEAWNRRTDNG